MDISSAVALVASKFVYRKDSIPLADSWRVMEERDGTYTGDCDDFTITTFWHVSDKSVFKFLLHLIVTHKYRVHHVKSVNGEPHLVGSYDGMWFDNFSKQALTKNEFFATTGHKYRFPMIGPLIAIYLALGLVFK